MIAPCGDDCSVCPKYTAQTSEELQKVAELWNKVGWTDKILSLEKIKCYGCSNHKICSYGLLDCLKKRNIQKCNQCADFPCDKIGEMLNKTKDYASRCKKLCSETEFEILRKAFFEKEINLELRK